MSIGNAELRAASIEASSRLYEPAAYSIETFCRAHSISRSKLYAMLQANRPLAVHDRQCADKFRLCALDLASAA